MRVLLLILALSPILVFGQREEVVRGRVLDADTELPIPFATVTLLDPSDSTIVAGTVSGDDGGWSLETAPRGGAMLLKAGFLGYDDTYLVLPAGGAAPSPLILHLRSGAQLLREIEVTGRKLTEIHRLDRQAFDAEQFTNARGGSATDVITNLPSVSVNGQGEITVRGATGFLLLIDGQPVQTDPAAVLAQLPANLIGKVEIITTPGAKYDPDGKAGILNITTKTGNLEGWSAAANLNLGLPAVRDFNAAEGQRRYSADANASYRSGKWNVGIGADYRRDDNGGQRDGYVNTLIGDVLTELPSFGERSHDRESYSGRLNVSYAPTKRQTLRGGLLAGIRTVDRTADILYRNQRRTTLGPTDERDPRLYYDRFLATNGVSDRGQEINRRAFYNENLRVRRGDFYIATLDYALELPNDAQLSFSGLYERTLLGGPTDNLIVTAPGSVDTLQYQFNTNDNPLDGYRFNADYAGKLGAATWASGYQYRYLRHPGDFLYLDRDLEANAFVTNPEFTNGILLRRDVHALYSQVSGAGERLEYAVGMRGEYFDRTVRLDRPDTTYRLDRFSLFPSVNLKYDLSDGVSAKAGYSRRIDRTTTFKMTPFPEREHNETLEQGDAELLPELTDLFELGLVGNFGDNTAFATAYYRRTRDVINRVNTIYNDTILNRIYTNVGEATALGLEAGLTVFPTDNWRVYLGGNVYRYGIEGRVFGEAVDVGNWVYSVNAATDVPLWRVADLQLGVNYLSERVTAQGRDSRFFNPYLNLTRELPEQRLTLTFQWQNISLGLWDANEQRITTARSDFFTTTNYVYETDIFRVGVGYRFTKLKNGVEGVKSEFGDQEF